MPRKDLYRKDASDRERETLESVLESESGAATQKVPVISVANSLTEKGVYEVQTSRNVVRVLFISRDETLLNPTQQSLDGFLQLSDLFDEVHIVILRVGITPKHPALRVGKNVWIYTVGSRHWWWTPVLGRRLIEQELVFVGGMRPDLIVARDPYESAVLALIVGNKYGRPVQVHVLEDYTTRAFLAAAPGNYWRRLIPRFVLPRVASVRTATMALSEMIGRKYVGVDIGTLPRFHNYDALLTMPPSSVLKDRYHNFSFFMLYIGHLGHESTLFRVLDGVRSFLRNPRVGLIVVGEGPAQSEFLKRTRALGIERQVVFEKASVNTDQYLKSAHVLIVSDLDADADEIILRGAAAGIPLVIAHNQFRDDVFTQGESALFFQHDSVEELNTKVNNILNDVGLRRLLVIHAQNLVQERFHSDVQAYRVSYRSSIERTLFVGEDNSPQV